MAQNICEILIVGAGPVGLLLGLLLQQRGVSVIIVERQVSFYPLPRAVAFDHESRRLFASADLSEQLELILENFIGKGGADGINFVWRDADLKLIVDLFTEAPTRSGYPMLMSFNQPSLEVLLEKAVLDRKITLIRGYALRDLQQNDSSVEGIFSKSDGKETKRVQNGVSKHEATTERSLMTNGTNGTTEHAIRVRASYVVGCDGANSTVRRLQDFTTTDLNFENDWLIIDLLLHDGYVPPRVLKLGAAQVCDPKRPTTCFFAGAGRKRFEFMRLPTETKEQLLQDDLMWEMLAPWGWTRDNCTLERKVIYTFKARWANEFYKHRVILAGDSLHLMPPFIGQGLNSGFRDAGALAWRLPLILSSITKPDILLQSYQNERIEHIRKLTEHCILLGGVICETEPNKAKQVHAELRKHPPSGGYDPPLGHPGVLTSQPEAGRLSLQRPLSSCGRIELFDAIYGFGWRLLSFEQESIDRRLTEKNQEFFLNTLQGKCVSINGKNDVTGDYRAWFNEQIGLDHVVLIRPDFYIFGHAALQEVNSLIGDLRAKMGVM